MILKFHNLKEQPFGVTPDPRYLFLTPTHQEALASLLYGVMSGRGFVGLIAKPGMGKTTLLFHLLQGLKDSARTVFLFQTLCTPREFLSSLLADLGIDTNDTDIVNLHAKLNEVLVRETRTGKRFVVVVDEAQNLDNSVLEVVRMLSNFETPQEKLMQIVLAGQPQLAERLASPALIQLRQRVSIIARLTPLSRVEVAQYVNHRLRVGGYCSDASLFSEDALDLIAYGSEGIPRNINNICFCSLSLACAQQRKIINRHTVEEVLRDLDLQTLREGSGVVEGPKRTAEKTTVIPLAVAQAGENKRQWPAKLGIAASLLLALSWPMLRARRTPGTAVTSDTSRPAENAPLVQAVTATNANAAAGDEKSLGAMRAVPPITQMVAPIADASLDARSIRVNPDETLYKISVENYGKYNRTIVARIQELNPRLKNPNLIQSGEKLRIPKDLESSTIAQSALDRASSDQSDKVEKP
jgi:general secretion pathway protein A